MYICEYSGLHSIVFNWHLVIMDTVHAFFECVMCLHLAMYVVYILQCFAWMFCVKCSVLHGFCVYTLLFWMDNIYFSSSALHGHWAYGAL
jgi:hypothetical protein